MENGGACAYCVKHSHRRNGEVGRMAFGQEIASWAKRVEATAARLEGSIIDAAYDELADRLAERLPEVAPIDSGALARSYTFRIEDGQLVVGNDAFYAAAIARFGGAS